jgi:FecR-like protein/putative zinc finger protein
MITCQTAKDLIEKLLDGTVDNEQLRQLKTHAESCAACRLELERCQLIEEVVTDAFISQTPPQKARERIVAEIASQPRAQVQTVRFGMGWARTAVAAAVTLTAGLLIGFAAGRRPATKPPEAPPLVRTPMQVGNLQGTVLVKHEGSDSWIHLKRDASVYRGDTFHSIARSGFILKLAGKASTLEVGQNSMLALKSYKPPTSNKKDETRFFLEQGECTASLESPHGRFFIDTPNGHAEALGTEFTVTVE